MTTTEHTEQEAQPEALEEALAHRPTTHLYDLLTEADVETPWLVEGFLIEDELGMVNGREFTGKSHIILDLALSVAAGLPDWQGFPIKEQAPVLYVPTEGRRGVSRRITSWVRWKASQGDLDHLREPWEEGYGGVFSRLPFERYDRPLILDPKSAETKKEIDWLRATIKEQGTRLVIFDVLSDLMPGVEENSSAFGSGLKLLKPDELGGVTVLVVHHEGLADKGRARGHSSILGAVDMRAGVEVLTQDNPEQPSHTVLKVTCHKQKNEDLFQPFALDLKRPDLSLLTPIITGRNSAQSMLLRSGSGSVQVQSAMTGNERTWFSQVQSGLNQGGVTPKVIREATGLGKGAESYARNSLIEKGFARDIGKGGQPLLVPTDKGLEAFTA